MKPSDLVRVNLPEDHRAMEIYHYHNHLGLVLTTKPAGVFGSPFAEVVLEDGAKREFNQRFLEAVNEAG